MKIMLDRDLEPEPDEEIKCDCEDCLECFYRHCPAEAFDDCEFDDFDREVEFGH